MDIRFTLKVLQAVRQLRQHERGYSSNQRATKPGCRLKAKPE